MANDAEQLLHQVLDKVQRNDRLRQLLAVLILLGLLTVVLYFANEMFPRSYSLRITGGELLGNRHYLAKILQAEAAKNNLSLQVIPVNGSYEALDRVDKGELDLAFIQGGLDSDYSHVTHVATVMPELLHVLVQPQIKTLADLRGTRINLGSKKGGTRVIAKEVLGFSELREGIDYVETNLSTETLIALPAGKLPDAIILTSFAPSEVADFLIKERGYTLLELPFPKALATRLGWVAQSQINAYMYQVSPAVPPRDIQTVGVNLHLVANKQTDPRAVFKTLQTLFGPGMALRMRMPFDESRLTVPSGFPLSQGSEQFLDRKNPLLSTATLDRIKAMFGLILSVASTILIILKWFRGAPAEPPSVKADDAWFIEQLQKIASLERDLATDLEPPKGKTTDLWQNASDLREQVLQRVGTARLDNPQLAALLMQASDQLSRRMESRQSA